MRRAFDRWSEREMSHLGITRRTRVSRWQGKVIDWHLAVGYPLRKQEAAAIPGAG
jgi:hypothetical protein